MQASMNSRSVFAVLLHALDIGTQLVAWRFDGKV